MPRRNKKAGQPNRAAQKDRHAYRVEARVWFKSTTGNRKGVRSANR